MKLLNKLVIITGASRGIGRAIALKFAEEGADLVLVARNRDELAELAEKIKELDRKVLFFPADITNQIEVEKIVQSTIEHFGKIDILINNAGIGLFKSVIETTLEEWQNVINVNLTGTFIFSKAVLPYMIERGQGQIINISSDVGKRTIPKASAYVASKFALQAFSEVLAKEVRKLGIKVGTILPGMTDTYFNNSTQGTKEKEEWLKAEDVASACLYMATAPKHAMVDEIILHPIIQEY